jgi:DNA modification methylase
LEQSIPKLLGKNAGAVLIGPYKVNSIITGDALFLSASIPRSTVKLILTDPPYPDYLTDKYKYKPQGIDFLKDFSCKQFVFWSAKQQFPLSYSAIHIWDKKTGAGSMYERIFERNGNEIYKVYRHYLINSTVAANFTGDVFTGHPSQKPAALIKEILLENTSVGDLVIDFFCGSGTVPAVCKTLGRNYLAFEIDPEVADKARDRVKNTQPPLFIPEQIQEPLF